jgi:hypothetical protein
MEPLRVERMKKDDPMRRFLHPFSCGKESFPRRRESRYLTLELMPYHTQDMSRQGIVLLREADSELFDLFQQKILELWDDAKE